MEAFGIKTITNNYNNKNLGETKKNIISLNNCSEKNIAYHLRIICNEFKKDSFYELQKDSNYINGNDNFEEIIKDLRKYLFN